MKPFSVFRRTVSGKQVMAMFVLVLFAAVAQAQQSIGNTLTTNKALESNQMLESNNKNYKAVMQGDGNFVIYRAPSTFIWASGSNGPRAANGKLNMQGDGNVCINTAANGNVWCNFSNGAVGNYFLILRDSGDLEVYNGTPANTAAATLVWTTLLDPNYYANRYADLKQAFGNDTRRLMDHWVSYGRFEGRSPKNGISDEGRQHALSVNLDTRFYANKYADLKQAFGYDAQKLYEHWVTYGMREGRVPNQPTDELLAPPPGSAHLKSVMRLGDSLRMGEYMISNNRRFIMFVQPDANVCVHETSQPSGVNGNNRRWCQNSRSLEVGPNYRYYTRIQEDGHFCTYRGNSIADQGQGISCTPVGAGGPIGRYFLALQDDGNLVVYKGNGPADNRGSIWDWITTRPSSGFNLNALVESVKTFVVNNANVVAGQATGAANTVAHVSASAAADLARETTNAANVVARETTNAANTVVRETVNTANLIANTSERVAVTVGRSVEQGGKIVGNEIVKDGKIVGYAVANLATEAWNLLNANCGIIGRRVFPIDGYFQGAKRITGALSTYAPAQVAAGANAANQCFEQVQDGFYCAFPAEVSKIVSQSASIPGNLINLATRVFEQAKTQECLIAGAATVGTGALGMQVCALGKVVVNDAQKAFACFSAAEAKGIMKKFMTPGATSHGFPSKEACEGIGVLAFSVAEKVITDGMSAEAKAATKAGKGRTITVVAEELRSVYKVMAAGARYDQIVGELESLPECKD